MFKDQLLEWRDILAENDGDPYERSNASSKLADHHSHNQTDSDQVAHHKKGAELHATAAAHAHAAYAHAVKTKDKAKKQDYQGSGGMHDEKADWHARYAKIWAEE